LNISQFYPKFLLSNFGITAKLGRAWDGNLSGICQDCAICSINCSHEHPCSCGHSRSSLTHPHRRVQVRVPCRANVCVSVGTSLPCAVIKPCEILQVYHSAIELVHMCMLVSGRCGTLRKTRAWRQTGMNDNSPASS